jgi:hypothetical protein
VVHTEEDVMRRVAVLALAAAVLVVGTRTRAQEPPKMPAPQKEHEWLKQFVGEWETEAEMVLEPGKPPVKSRGTESARLLGGFWIVSEFKGEFLGVPMTGIMTVGYDTQKKKYVGTFVCSSCDQLWKYEGTVKGQVLTLETEGPNPTTPGKTCKMRDVMEIKGNDLRMLTSSLQAEDGKWVTFMTMTARRKK